MPWNYEPQNQPRADAFDLPGAARTPPGKTSLTQRMAPRVITVAPPVDAPAATASATPVQAARGPAVVDDPFGFHLAAQRGVAGAGGPLPHLAPIAASFGHHDVSGVRAHVGGAAAEAASEIGAQAYATGDSVAFAGSPDLHLAAHEAAHVVQQRAGVQLKGGVGQAGDAYERHADAVADLVVQGRSAAGLLDQMAPAGAATSGVQRAAVQRNPTDDRAAAREAIHGHAPAPPPGPAAPAVEGEWEGAFDFPAVHLPGHLPLTPWAQISSIDLVGTVHYRIPMAARDDEPHFSPRGRRGGHGAAPPAPGPGEHEAEEPSTTVHVGAARGTDEHGHAHAEIEAGITHHLMDLGNLGHLDVGAGAAVSPHGGHVGVSAGGGQFAIGTNPTLMVPIPAFDLHLVDVEGGVPHFLTAEVRAGLPTMPIRMDIAGRTIEIVPQLEMVLHVEPNWPAIAQTLGLDATGVAAEGAVVGTAATAALEIGAVVLAPAAALAFMYEMFTHEITEPEELSRRSVSVGFSLFHYCHAYRQTWLNQVDSLVGSGSAQGERDAHRDLAAFRAGHPGVDPVAQARMWGERTIYSTVYDMTMPSARQYLESFGIEDHVGMVDVAMHSVSRSGGRYSEYMGGGHP